MDINKNNMKLKHRFDTLDLILSPLQLSDTALDALAGDFVASSAAPTVKSGPCVPTETDPQVEMQVQHKLFFFYFLFTAVASKSCFLCLWIQLLGEADNALDALSDTLKDTAPAPLPALVPAKEIVKVAQMFSNA